MILLGSRPTPESDNRLGSETINHDRDFTMTILQKTLNALMAGAGLLFAASALSAPFTVNGPTAANVDTDPISPTVLNFNVPDSGQIDSLTVSLALDDTIDGGGVYWDNVRVVLSHLGIDVVLMDLSTDVAESGSSLSATFEDGGADLAAALVVGGVTAGTFAPQDPLAAFNGVELSGQWTITLSDDEASDDGTDLSLFTLAGETADAPAPSAEPIPTLPLGGLLLLILGLLAAARFGLHRRSR